MLKMCQCELKPDAVVDNKGEISRIRNEEKESKICFLQGEGNSIWKKRD